MMTKLCGELRVFIFFNYVTLFIIELLTRFCYDFWSWRIAKGSGRDLTCFDQLEQLTGQLHVQPRNGWIPGIHRHSSKCLFYSTSTYILPACFSEKVSQIKGASDSWHEAIHQDVFVADTLGNFKLGQPDWWWVSHWNARGPQRLQWRCQRLR